MSDTKKKGNPVLGRLVVKLGEMISNGDCGLDEDEEHELVNLICTRKLSLEQAADYLHMDRTTLSRHVRCGEIQEPRKDKGSKKYYFEKDLMKQ